MFFTQQTFKKIISNIYSKLTFLMMLTLKAATGKRLPDMQSQYEI